LRIGRKVLPINPVFLWNSDAESLLRVKNTTVILVNGVVNFGKDGPLNGVVDHRGSRTLKPLELFSAGGKVDSADMIVQSFHILRRIPDSVVHEILLQEGSGSRIDALRVTIVVLAKVLDCETPSVREMDAHVIVGVGVHRGERSFVVINQGFSSVSWIDHHIVIALVRKVFSGRSKW